MYIYIYIYTQRYLPMCIWRAHVDSRYDTDISKKKHISNPQIYIKTCGHLQQISFWPPPPQQFLNQHLLKSRHPMKWVATSGACPLLSPCKANCCQTWPGDFLWKKNKNCLHSCPRRCQRPPGSDEGDHAPNVTTGRPVWAGVVFDALAFVLQRFKYKGHNLAADLSDAQQCDKLQQTSIRNVRFSHESMSMDLIAPPPAPSALITVSAW